MKSQLFPLVQFKSIGSVIGVILLVSAFFVGLVVLLHFWKQIPFGILTRDAAASVEFPIYTGFLSQIGILFWAASAAVCLFSVKALSRDPNNLEMRSFLFVSGLLTMLLGLDDTFLLHEELFPYFGIPEKVVYASYVGIVLSYLIKFCPMILKTEYILLVMALGFFGVSVAFDVLIPTPTGVEVILGMDECLLEDSAKLIGIVSWLTYFFRVGISTTCHNAAQ